ncbi:hypothetical protein V8F44DRAFT_652381 [Aspergillus fumigatus]|jgi:hypothetical protein
MYFNPINHGCHYFGSLRRNRRLSVVCGYCIHFHPPPTIIDSLGSASFPTPVLDFLTASMDSFENIHASKNLEHSKDGLLTNALTGGRAEFPVVCQDSPCGSFANLTFVDIDSQVLFGHLGKYVY